MRPEHAALAEGILFTDFYQLTMAQVYYRLGIHETPAQFDHFFRRYPDYGTHQAGYCINAGLGWLLDWMDGSRFGEKELDVLRAQRTSTGRPLFAADFLDWLGRCGDFSGLTLHAIPEGRVVHPSVPLTVVEGPLALAQVFETPLLNILNFQTLIATKAARMRASGRGRLLLEFGMRRGQGEGVNAGTRAALIGGADFSSNVGISHLLGFPPKGTHAHSLVQALMALGQTELDAFRAYAATYPDDCLLLVDTISTLESGVPNAIRVFDELRRQGHRPVGIRLDSGDLAYLSIQAAKQLDAAGFPETAIVLSNNMDEMVIWQVLTQIEEDAPTYGMEASRVIGRLAYGVGTSLITSRGQPALDGVYKLVAVCEGDTWRPAFKVSETPEKTINPGHKAAWRLYDQRGRATTDLLTLADEGPPDEFPRVVRHPVEHTRRRTLNAADISGHEPLLQPVRRPGWQAPVPDIEHIRRQRQADLERLDPGVRRLINPHVYHVSLSERLYRLKDDLITEARQSRSLPAAPAARPPEGATHDG